MLTPPDGSKIKVGSEVGHPKIMIPQPDAGKARYFIGPFLLFWLCGWFVGWISASSELLFGDGGIDAFLLFWLCGWTAGGVMAMLVLYKSFRPARPEVIILTKPEMLYDSGIPPFRYSMNGNFRAEFWENLFQKRMKTAFPPEQLRTLKLREFPAGNRLTIDQGSSRIDLAAGAGETEREWLYGILKAHYGLNDPGSPERKPRLLDRK